MSLSAYHKKRTFSRTPEPKGEKKDNVGPLTFVVQKHEATRLHYDFRLELDGVLLSWAVPKGPSMNPEDKHMAIHVEDHPMDYASFEGIIPKGNYGAGTVMVWDNGVYGPYDSVERKQAEKLLRAQYEKGHLTFIMLGKKLKGEFALIKTPRMGDDAWLLIKKGDEYASKKDILKEDKSVLTGRSMEQIAKQAEKKQQVWQSKPKNLDLGDAPKADMPHHIRPMLAETVDQPFDKKGWIFETKWDGYRAIAEIQSGNVDLYSRNLQDYNEKFAPVAKALQKFPGSAVLDGEVVVVDKDGKPNFQWLQDYPRSKKGELIYYVFDILYFDGYSLEKLPLLKRKEILRKVLPDLPHVRFSDHIEETGTAFYKQAAKMHLEGVMGKNGESVYRPGVRTSEWLKIKTQKYQEAVIGGFTQPRGGRKHFGSLVLGVFKKGKLEYIGHSGGGFDSDELEAMYRKLQPLVQNDCPFVTKPQTNEPATWVKPVLACEIAFTQWTEGKQMRHPIFIKVLDGTKGAKGTKDTKVFTKEAPSIDEKSEVQIGKQKVELSNLSKVFWPKEGYTKGDLINYYKEVAPVLLPHLKDRPESLLRYPDGVQGEKFFQKNTSNLVAKWIKKTKVHSNSGNKTVEYLLCQDEASLLYMINLGCIDLNPWNSRIKHLEKPDYLIIDLDPEDISFAHVVEVAKEFGKLLEKLHIPGYPKTTGATGIHIYIPLGAQYSYDLARKFAELLCVQVHAKLPEITSMERSPDKRQGKVYLDYLQNSKGQTLASVYSVRAQPGATVSAPLEWNELTSKLHPSQFTIKNIPNRIQKKGDLFKGVLGKGIEMEKALNKLDKLMTE